jgi:DNA (cytosine-5)-methyltransferase 1
MLHSPQAINKANTHAEFFAGIGGMAFGLNHFNTVWANDICPIKERTFKLNHNDVEFICDDINNILVTDIPNTTLVSATYPCTNTSCAGDRTGLLGVKSGVVYKWLELMKSKGGAETHPFAILENPTGLIARNHGSDLTDLISQLNSLGYAVNLMVVDAKHFVPQSRPRIFINCIDRAIISPNITPITSSNDLPQCKNLMTNPLRKWITKNLDLNLVNVATRPLPTRTIQLESLIELDEQNTDHWADENFKDELIRLLVGKQLAKFQKLVNSPFKTVSTVARRGRTHPDGTSFNATEINVSGVAPAQRPYKGGSSRCWVLVAGQGSYDFKVVTPRESARLMGFDDTFKLPSNAKEAYQCTGDSVVPQAVSWVEENVYQPLLHLTQSATKEITVNEQFTFSF